MIRDKQPVAYTAPPVLACRPSSTAGPRLPSDQVPICGLHRKPYMVLGWGMLWGGALLLAVLPTLTLPLASTIFLCMTVSYLLADCAADAVLVALSTREAAEARGSLL